MINYINLGYFRSEWKLAKIKSLFKNGSKTDQSCYQTISLLSSLSKVFENILFNRMMHFIKKFKIIDEYQFGFQQGKSCKNKLNSLTEFLGCSVDQNLKGLSCFIDLKKLSITYAIKQWLKIS